MLDLDLIEENLDPTSIKPLCQEIRRLRAQLESWGKPLEAGSAFLKMAEQAGTPPSGMMAARLDGPGEVQPRVWRWHPYRHEGRALHCNSIRVAYCECTTNGWQMWVQDPGENWGHATMELLPMAASWREARLRIEQYFGLTLS